MLIQYSNKDNIRQIFVLLITMGYNLRFHKYDSITYEYYGHAVR